MQETVTIKGNIITEQGVREGYIRLENGIISSLPVARPEGRIIDFGDSFIAPGFIDLHIHGIHHSLVDNGPEELSEMCRILPRYGVTGFLPTVTSKPAGEDAAFVSLLAEMKTEGAAILGFHMEGPFLKLTGALSSDAISGSNISRVESLIKAAEPYRAIFSISPDVSGIENILPLMSLNNTPVFITHTMATVEQTQKAIELGVRHATHFYDVFPCPPVQDPGVRPCGAVEAVLADERVSVDFILDGVHVDPVAVKMAMLCKRRGPGCVCLISDSNIGTGLEPGRYTFNTMGEIEFVHKGAPARMVKDNTLAGSGLTLDQALRNAVKWLDIDLPEAVKMVSTNPAKVLGLDNSKGKLEKGYDADFVILNRELQVTQTWIKGKEYFLIHESSL